MCNNSSKPSRENRGKIIESITLNWDPALLFSRRISSTSKRAELPMMGHAADLGEVTMTADLDLDDDPADTPVPSRRLISDSMML